MSFNLGINVVEVDGRATPSIQPAPTSVTGFIVHSRRGLPGIVAEVTNWTQFTERFGAHTSDAYGAYAIRGFFDNGGTVAKVTRVVSSASGGSAALVTSASGPFALPDGGTLTVDSDVLGAPATVAFEGEAAVLVGGSGPFDLETNGDPDEIALTVNGTVQGPYTFDPADFDDLTDADAEAVAAVLNREFVGIQAWVEDDDLRVGTDRRGTSAALEAAGEAAAKLGLASAESGSGNVADLSAVTASEVVAHLEAEVAPLLVTEEQGQVEIRHPEFGESHTIQITDTGASVHAELGFDTDEHVGSEGDAEGAARAARLTLPGGLTLMAAYRGAEDPGAWGNDLAVQITENEVDSERFDLNVRLGDGEVESWEGLSTDGDASHFIEDVLNDSRAGSKYVMVEGEAPAVPPDPTGGFVSLEEGDDGEFPGEPEQVAALSEAVDLFKNVDIQLLCCPETDDVALVQAALTHCEAMNDRMFVGHTPRDLDAQGARDYGGDLRGDNVYGALYFPWIQVAKPGGGHRWIPPTGHILGMYARTDRERGVWKAPAGNATRLNGALDVQFHLTEVDHTQLVKRGSVNAVRFIPGQGIVVDSSRTLSSSGLWLYVNVRLLFNMVKSSLKNDLRWVVQEPNTPELWNKIKHNSVTPFLMGLWRRGAFGPGSPEEVFTVKCDEENNPPDKIQHGILTVEVYFYPSRPAETIIITVGQQEGAGSASES